MFSFRYHDFQLVKTFCTRKWRFCTYILPSSCYIYVIENTYSRREGIRKLLISQVFCVLKKDIKSKEVNIRTFVHFPLFVWIEKACHILYEASKAEIFLVFGGPIGRIVKQHNNWLKEDMNNCVLYEDSRSSKMYSTEKTLSNVITTEPCLRSGFFSFLTIRLGWYIILRKSIEH